MDDFNRAGNTQPSRRRLLSAEWPAADTSPGILTDALFALPCTSIHVASDYVAHVTEARHDYLFGNYLAAKGSPHSNTFDRQMLDEAWNTHLGRSKELLRRMFQWEVPVAEIAEAKRAAKEAYHASDADLGITIALTATRDSLCRTAGTPALRPVASNAAFRELVAAAHEDLGDAPDAIATHEFLDWQYNQFRAAAENGGSKWWQVLDGAGNPASQCGIAFDGSLGRYRDVLTRPSFRRQGFGKALIAATAAQALDGGLCARLVIVADANSIAERLYRAAEFTPISALVTLRAPPGS